MERGPLIRSAIPFNNCNWRVYYAVALANMIEIHLETLEKRRINLVK